MLSLLDRLHRRLKSQARRLDRIEAGNREPLPGADPRSLSLFEWGKWFLPHFLKKPPSRFHLELCADLERLRRDRGTRLARLAPRGSAKSTWGTLVHPLRCAVEGTEPFTMILSDTADQATDFVTQIKAELEGNPRLAAAYPKACGTGPEWRAGRVRLTNGCVIEAKSRGGRIRGRRNRQDRPTLIVVDDCQGNRDIVSPVERKRGWDWMAREVIPAGEEGRTTYVSVGTALHREAVAVRLLTTPGWEGKVYRSIERWPDRADLWDDWTRLATNMADQGRDATARAFYDARRDEMEAGAVVLWPEGRNLYSLMRRLAEIGRSAFDTEDMGNPSAVEGAEFPAELFDRPGVWFDDWPTDMVLRVQSLDPSKGNDSKSGDFQSHVLVGLDTRGDMWCEAAMHHELIPLMVDRALDFALASGFGRIDSLVVEENGTLGMLLPDFQRHANERNAVIPLRGILQTQNKLVRVRRLGVYFARNRIRFRNTPHTRLLVDQLRDFPGGTHDDGPDALELAVRELETLTNPR
ncbi:MAG: hypothetical protein C0467_31885 [Planctomycetaceae bacterium]|nr:hypothetical protein [Planctomycetaceae bacterium]